MRTYSRSYNSDEVILENSNSHRTIIAKIALKGKQPAVRLHIAVADKITVEQISDKAIAINILGAIDGDYILKGLEEIVQMYRGKQ